MGRLVHDTFTEVPAGNLQLTDHTPEVGGPWVPHADYIGTLRVAGSSGKQAFSNPLDNDEGLYAANALVAATSVGVYARMGLLGVGTGEVVAVGSVTLTGGASGSVDTITVNGVNILHDVQTFISTLANTAANCASNISSFQSVHGYTATTGGTATITISAPAGSGALPNGFVVNSTRTTITASHVNMASGVNGSVDNSIGFCYLVQGDDKSYYRVRNSGSTWALEKVVNGAITSLATSTAAPIGNASYWLTVQKVGAVHTVTIQVMNGSLSAPVTTGIIPTVSLTATDSSIPSGGRFGLWGSSGGSSTGSAPNQTASKAWVAQSTIAPLEGGTNDADLTLPQISLAATIILSPSVLLDADITLPQVVVVGSSSTVPNDGDGDIALPQVGLVATISHTAAITAELPAITADIVGHIGGAATIAAALPSITADLRGGFPGGFITLPQVAVDGTIILGQAAQADITLPQIQPAATLIQYGQATGNIALPQVVLDASGIVGNAGSGSATLPQVQLVVSGYAGLALSAALVLPQVQVDARGFSQYLASINANLVPLTAYMVGGPDEGAVVRIVVLNLRTGGVTEYNGWTFNSFATLRGRTLAASSSGIFELTGETDDGVEIASDFRTIVTDLSPIDVKGEFAAHGKRPTDAYLSYQSDEPMLFTVYVDDQEYEYDVPKGRYMSPAGISSKVRPHKAELGKGIETNYLQFGIKNIAGGDFTFDALRVLLDILKRRV